MKFVKLIFVVILFSMCSSDSTNKLESFDYSNPKLGWDIKVPNGWQMNDLRDVIEKNDAGIKAMEEAMDQEVDLSSIDYSLNFQKDESNVFQSVFEPFEETEPNLWERNNAAVKALFSSVYKEQGIGVDTTATTIENIGGVDFKTYEITLFQEGNVQLNQIFYSTFLKGYDFSVCLTFNSDENKKQLLDIWRRSKFN